jgi:DNA-directed RNA polymerase specialized sigma24 family protein
MNRLPGTERRPVTGLSTAEAAGILGLGLAAVKSRVHRGRLALRRRVAGYSEAGRAA